MESCFSACMAMSRAVLPSMSLSFLLAPLSSKSLQILPYPCFAARCRGVAPVVKVFVDGMAPLSKRNFPTS